MILTLTPRRSHRKDAIRNARGSNPAVTRFVEPQGGFELRLAVVNVANGANVYVRLAAVKYFLGHLTQVPPGHRVMICYLLCNEESWSPQPGLNW